MKAHDEDRLGPDPGRVTAARKRPLLFLVIAILVLLALGLSLRAVLRSTEPAKPEAVQIAPAPASSPAPDRTTEPAHVPQTSGAPGTADSQPPLPELEHSDAEVRATLGDILPALAQPALQPDDLLRRVAVQSDGFARGKLLRDKLQLPAVGGKLVVEERDGRQFLAPANYARYDSLVDAASEIDTDALARWFKRYEPLLQQAFDELGNGPGDVRSVLLSGLDLMLAAPEVTTDIELIRPSVFYKYADPVLEALPETQKLLIRMGPRNREILLDRARRLRQALSR